MSWDAYLNCDGCGSTLVDQNYTHNVNCMANAVLSKDELREGGRAWWASRGRADVVARIDSGELGGSWWELLHDKSGPDGAALLDRIIKGLEADPDRFRAMNPDNGWGDYDSFLKVLTEMRDRVPECPSTWRTSG